MRNRLAILLFLLLPAFVVAQQKTLDSLHNALGNAPNDTIRMDACNTIAIFYGEANRDSTIWYREQALKYARSLKLIIDEADILVGEGYIYSVIRNYPKSYQCLLASLKILEDPANNKNPFTLTDGQSAQCSRLSTLCVAQFVLAGLYSATGNNEKSLVSYKKALELAKTVNDTTVLAYTNGLLGSAYLDAGKLDSALLLEQRSLDFFTTLKKNGDNKYEGMVLGFIGKIYMKQGKFEPARDSLLRAANISKVRNNIAAAADCLLLLAELYQNNGKYDSSIYYARQALMTYNSLAVATGRAESYARLAGIYKIVNKQDSAFHYLSLASVLKDSLASAERKNLDAYQNIGFNEQFKVQGLEKEKIQTRNRIRTLFMSGGIALLLLLAFVFYRNNRLKQKAKLKIEKAYDELKSTQQQLIQSEKMASLGELTAGIAHEIQNPLNFVNNFSEVNTELIEEANVEMNRGNVSEVKTILNDIKENEQKINQHGKRADAIVKGMLQHSRSSSGVKEPTDINSLADEYLRLAYHGLRAKDHSFNATMKTDFDPSIGKINIVPQDIGRVILNLVNNAFYAASAKALAKVDASSAKALATAGGPEPTVWMSTKKMGDKVFISVRDNGSGIPPKVLDKIFQPFFTTKPTGQGTGLGLSLSYDIVKAHGGEITVETTERSGTEFIIQLPFKPVG